MHNEPSYGLTPSTYSDVTFRAWAPRAEWGAIVEAAERIGGRRWSEAVEVHGNWVCDGVLYTAVRHLGYRLAEVYRQIPGLKCAAAGQAVKRFGRMLPDDAEREHPVRRLRRALDG